MADSVIGALRVLLGVDTAAFSSGLKGAESSLDSFGSSFKRMAATLSITAVAAKFTYDIKKMIDTADELGKASQKFGVPVESLSALKYAAELADVSFESLGKGLGKLSKAMLESGSNPASEAAKNFQALGISVTGAGGSLKSTETVFTDIAEKFSTMEDGAAKTALAIRVFGRAGADLIPLLNAGRTGVKAMTDEAARLGIVISAETAVKAELFNDTLKKIEATSKAVYLLAAEALLPVLQKLADGFLQARQNGSLFRSVIENLVTEKDIQEFQYYAQVLENFARILSALKAFGGNIGKLGLTAALEELDKAIDVNKQKLLELKASWLSLGVAGAFESMENLPGQLARVAKGMTTVNMATLGTKNALDSFLDSQKKSIAGHEAEAQALGLGLGVKEKLKIQLEAEAIALTNNINLSAAYQAKITALGDAAAAAAIKLAGAQMQQEALSPWDLYQKKLTDINLILSKHPELADAAAQASMRAAASMADAYGTAAAGAAGNFAEFFKTFGKGSKEMFLVGKAFSISQAIINTLVGATKALAQFPPPLGPILAASVVALGMATVAKIVAEKPPTGMALGGQFQVGGAGGVDSQMVPIMATPGERVSIDQNKYGDSGGSGRTVTIAGIKPKDYYTGDVLRDFVENLNTAIGDGLKIKMA